MKKLSEGKQKLIALVTISIIVIVAFIGILYSATDNHYVLDVVKETATNNDGTMQVTERIIKDSGEEYFDSKKLKYQVELKNIVQSSNIENQIAMIIDTSYSMEANDTNRVAKTKAIDLSNEIFNNVKNARISISNNGGVKLGMTNISTSTADKVNGITNIINGLTYGDGNDCSQGLDYANSTFVSATQNGNTVKKYIILFTDSTDDVSSKMAEIKNANPDVQIISILIDMTSSSYINYNDNSAVCGDVYLVCSDVDENNVSQGINIYDSQIILDKINKSLNEIKLTNIFSDEILTYFKISEPTVDVGSVVKTNDRYVWDVDRIAYSDTATLNFNIELDTSKDIDAGLIFDELFTNKTQDISYTSISSGEQNQLSGSDARENTESTIIKICQGYDLKINAVNESNRDLLVEGIKFKVVGTNEQDEEVCNIIKTTDSDGYIEITADEARALRSDGIINYVVTPIVNLVGYSNTDPVTFNIDNNKTVRKLQFDDNGNTNLTLKEINESYRYIDVSIPINTQKIGFELKLKEKDNSFVTISDAEFELIQPKLNNKYEMDVLSGKTNETGTLVFSPTVMTKNGTYDYILRQISTQDTYDLTQLTLISIKYEDAKIISITHKFNDNVTTEIVNDVENHVLVTVQNECVAQDPFDLQINLSDIDSSEKLEGATYLISTTNANNQVRTEYATTDENGQINTSVFGTGNLRLEITEQLPKTGYETDKTTKTLILNRSEGIITIWNQSPTNLNTESPNNTSIIVNLSSKKKTEQNIVKLHIVNSEEQDTAVGSGIVYTLKDDETDTIYGPQATDRNGDISFTINTNTQGRHLYTLQLNSDSLPSEYNVLTNETNIKMGLTFDGDGYIQAEDIAEGDSIVISDEFSVLTGESTVEYTAIIKIGYELEESNTAYFDLKLSDYDNHDLPISGASYNIDIEWNINDSNGELITRTKTITGRKTDTNGMITTHIVKGNEVRIYVKEVNSAAGYVMDGATQEIYLRFNNNGSISINQSPYDLGLTNTREPNQGAKDVNGRIVYNHLNKKRSADDTYLNLTLSKIDQNGAYVNGKIVNIKSDTLKDKSGNSLDLIMTTGAQGSDGTITIDYGSYILNKENYDETINVSGFGSEDEEKYFDLEITELEQDSQSETGYKEKEETKVKCRLIYRLKDSIVNLTNVETIYGNRLVINKTFSSANNSDEEETENESYGVFLSNIILDLYTNYDEIGNLSLDLKKQNKYGDALTGAKYDLRVVNPDSTVVRKTIDIENGEESDDIEVKGLSVSVGSIIELTETETVPIGYVQNENTETFEVTDIDVTTGEITLEQEAPAYNPSRVVINKLASTMTKAGTTKTNYELKFIDYQVDQFEFDIKTVDASSGLGVARNAFKLTSSEGAIGNIITDMEGSGLTQIGAGVANKTIEYTVSMTKAATYYKSITNPIKVYVVFNDLGKVDATATMNAQTDSGYNTLWTIENLSIDSSDGNTYGRIGIKILLNHLNPLTVNINTVDKINNTTISNVEYKITPSSELEAKGSNLINVGYVKENGTETYTINQSQSNSSYVSLADRNITIKYESENITDASINSTETLDNISISGAQSVTVTLYAEPRVPFEITNSYYFDNTPVQGASFRVTNVTSEVSGTGTTNSNGITGLYVDELGINTSVLYKVSQETAGQGYSNVDDFYVKVAYNENREITNVDLVDKYGNLVTNNRFVSVSFKKTSTYSTYNNNDKGIVTIKIQNYPSLKMNISNFDRRDGTTALAGTVYSVTSSYLNSEGESQNWCSDDEVITNELGLGIADLNKIKVDKIVTYTITEKTPATGFQTLGKTIKINVTFDSDGYVTNAQLENDSNANIATVTLPENIKTERDRFVVNVKLINNPVLQIHVTALNDLVKKSYEQGIYTDLENIPNSAIYYEEDYNGNLIYDDSGNTIPITYNSKVSSTGFQTIGKNNAEEVYTVSSATRNANLSGTAETSTTDLDGKTDQYMDRTLENEDMYYNIDDVLQAYGYEWLSENVVLKSVYDSNGQLADASIIGNSTRFAKVTSYDANNFVINVNIYFEEIKKFSVNMDVTDVYDSNKKIDGLEVEAYIAEDTSYTINEKYKLIDNDKLISGVDNSGNTDEQGNAIGDGSPDYGHGVDYKIINEYEEGAGTKAFRLNIKNNSRDGYYINSNDKTLGYYKGSNYYENAKYQVVEYQYLMFVTFNDNGQIVDAQISSGLNNNLGWLCDNRYISVSHTSYCLNIHMKLFPMLDLNVSGMDNYLYESEINSNGLPNKLSGSKYTVTTTRHQTHTQYDEFIQAGYIGYGNSYGIGGKVQGKIYEDTDELIAPIQNNETRQYYVFEEIEPTNYQQYADRYIVHYTQRLVAIISIKFDEYGEIDYDNSIIRKVDENEIKPYMDEDGTTYLSSNNIKEYNYWYTHDYNVEHKSNRDVDFYIGYGLTTTLDITAIDDISQNTISNIRMCPFLGDTYFTNLSYEYNTNSYRYTNSDGNFNIKYWGAAEKDARNKYIIGSYRQGNEYNGYIFPSDMADSSQYVNTSGDINDYFSKLDIVYDENGRIKNVTSVGSDLWGDDNVLSDITWDSATGKIYLKMIYSRNFQLKLNKTNYYDNTVQNLNATFDIVSEKGLSSYVYSSRGSTDAMKSIGKVYANKTVKYTLTETSVPDGYYPITDNVDFYVTFDKDGNIGTNKVSSSSEYFEVVSTSEQTSNENKTSPDLTINIKNKPAFNVMFKVKDKFYKQLGLENVYLDIIDSKGNQALGNPQTDKNGYANVTMGVIYPGETVRYYIKQSNTVNGYYKNTVTIELVVEFNDAGKIESYYIASGDEVVDGFDSTKYINKKSIDNLQIMNMPKDLKIGLYKYDKTTNQSMDSIPFKIIKEDLSIGEITENTLTTESDGTIISAIDTFKETSEGKSIKYTIHENSTPSTYRTMQDVAFIVRYNADGSIGSMNQVPNENDILNTECVPEIAIGTIKYLNNEKVHFLVNVPNDNSYDIIIKNEDENYAGLGIEGSTFDVSVNGTTYSPAATDSNGKTIINDLMDSGEINIQISQRNCGEGYRLDLENTAEIKLIKGSDIYSLDLDSSTVGFKDENNATTEKATIVVDEVYGTITITFKNETKNQLTVFNKDIDTLESLSGAVFEITEQQIDNTGNTIGEPIILTSNENNTTDVNGKLYFDLGIAPQSEKWIYTFNQITPPEDYNEIIPVTMTVTYDQYGRISSQTSNLNTRLNTIMEDNWYNCHNMYALIYNGDISPAYTLKVVTEDSDTRKRISGSNIYMNITDSTTGNLITVEPKSSSSAGNGTTSLTGNLGIDGLMYNDSDLKKSKDEIQNSGITAPAIIEKGLTYIDNIDYEGTINIEVSQVGLAPGYVYGNQRTDGNIKIKANYIPQLSDNPEVDFEIIDNDGFDVKVDNKNRIITVTILNESQVTFDITTMQYQSDAEAEPIYIPGVSYEITSEIITSTNTIQTDLNERTSLSDENGNIIKTVGKAYSGKTVLYTLKQSSITNYNIVDDIRVEVQYDSNGYIKYFEILSSEDNCYIVEEETVDRTIKLMVVNRKQLSGYKINLEKHTMDSESDLYAYDKLLPNVKYKITVTQEYGTAKTEWTGITDENGVIDGIALDGYGYITIVLEELEAPNGYDLDITRTLKIYRNPDTGNTEEINSNVNYTGVSDELENDEYGNQIIWVKPIDKQSSNKYTLVLNKYSIQTKKYITDNQAFLSGELIRKDEDGNAVYKDTIYGKYTDKNGKAIIDNLNMPDEEGDYILRIKEEEAPKGYVKLEEPVEVTVKFVKDQGENIVINKVEFEEGNENVSLSTIGKQILGLNIGNNADYQIQEDEYSLDITKIDVETREPIQEPALFKAILPDEQNTRVYVETVETELGYGKLDYCYIEQDKDYTVRLTHMKKPTEPGTHVYSFKEVTAPDGYTLIDEELILTIEFAQNEEGEIYIANATSSNENYLKIRSDIDENQGWPTSQALKIDIINGLTERNKFKVHYDANDNGEGTVVPADQTKQRDVDLTLDSLEPTRENYKFKGWGVLTNSRVPTFMPGDTYSLDQDITLYAIWDEGLYVKSSEYLIGTAPENYEKGTETRYKSGDKYISRILPYVLDSEQHHGTKKQELLSNIETNATSVDIYDKNGNSIDEDTLIGTGMTIKLIKDEEEVSLEIAVTGDINGDGKIKAGDLSKLIFLSGKTIVSSEGIAADMDYDGRVRATDLLRMKTIIGTGIGFK